MPEVPDDLMRFADVLKEYRPKRGWWEIRIERGDIQRYAVPGERGIWLSRADVERMTRPQPYEAVYYDADKDKDAG
jgi:hypothetical protein